MRLYRLYVAVTEFACELRAGAQQSINAMRLPTRESDQCLLAVVAGTSLLLCTPHLLDAGLTAGLIAVGLLLCIRIRRLVPLGVMLAAMGWANWNFIQHWQTQLPQGLAGQSIQIVGQVDNLPDTSPQRTRFRLRIERVLKDKHQASIEMDRLHGRRIQLSCYRCPHEILPDQRWQFTVRLKQPHGFASWGAFDFEKFLFRHQIVASGYVRTGEANQLMTASLSSTNLLRWKIKQQLKMKMPESTIGRAMIAALMIGDKSWLSPAQRKTFQATGVSHLMAISGLHVGLVFLSVTIMLKWLMWPIAHIYNWCPRQQLVLLPALLIALLYSALAGFAISTQRAFVMLCVYVLCRLCAREVSLLRVLLLAAVLLLLIDPFSILDAGFWLSCGAVLIIALVSQTAGRLSLIRLQPVLWVGMLPLTVLLFGQVSLISPLVNLLMVPLFCTLLIPPVLISLVLMQLGIDELSTWLLELLENSFEFVYAGLIWMQDLPFALYFPQPLFVLKLTALAAIVFAYSRGFRFRHIVCCVGIALVFVRPGQIAEGELHIAVLDVGQGLSIVIEARDYVVVYDTGPAYASGFSTAEAVLLPYLRQRGINHIDVLIISHADNDHIGGYPVLKDNMDIEKILTSNVDRLPGAELCRAGQSWQSAQIRFDVVSPSPATSRDNNNQSCVLSVQNEGFRVLLTGDIERPVEELLIAEHESIQADFLLVPHHGSNTSSTEQFVGSVEPRLALLSAGYGNHYGHPHRQVVERYKSHNVDLVSTADSGSILLKFNNKAWRQSHFRKDSQRFWHRQKKPK